jgi:hypothetical protein
MTSENEREAGYRLIEQAASVDFRVEQSDIAKGPDGAEFGVTIELRIIHDPDEGFSTDDSGALGFLFAIALQSFADARPRGMSEVEYRKTDEFSVSDFVNCLSHTIGGELRFDADYVRGRRMKTRVKLRADGCVVIETIGRGKAAEHWLARLQGSKRLQLIGKQL